MIPSEPPSQHMEFSICFIVFFFESFPYLIVIISILGSGLIRHGLKKVNCLGISAQPLLLNTFQFLNFVVVIVVGGQRDSYERWVKHPAHGLDSVVLLSALKLRWPMNYK